MPASIQPSDPRRPEPPVRGPWIPFALEDRLFALPLQSVERVVRAVEITPLPGAPEIVRGIINVEGRVVAVIDPRSRFGLATRSLAPDQQMVIARTHRRRLVLVVDHVKGVLEVNDDEVADASDILPDLPYIRGVLKLQTELVLIHDLETFLSLEEEDALDRSLEGAT